MQQYTAQQILKVRDALVDRDLDEAYHQLYTLADPEYKIRANPWEDVERIAATPSPAKAEQEGQRWVKASSELPKNPGDPLNFYKLNGFKVNGNFYEQEGEFVFGVIHHDGDYVIRKKDWDRLEWLDESTTPPVKEQLYTLKEVRKIRKESYTKGAIAGYRHGLRQKKSEAPVKEVAQPAPSGLRWIKGEYERLYEQVKSGKRTVCYADYNFSAEIKPRDICTIRPRPEGQQLELVSRGHGYGSTLDASSGTEIERFIQMCLEVNVEWLEESDSPAPVQVDQVTEYCKEIGVLPEELIKNYRRFVYESTRDAEAMDLIRKAADLIQEKEPFNKWLIDNAYTPCTYYKGDVTETFSLNYLHSLYTQSLQIKP